MNAPAAKQRIADDMLAGARAIGDYLGFTERKVWHLAALGEIPTFKLGGTVCARRSELREALQWKPSAARTPAMPAVISFSGKAWGNLDPYAAVKLGSTARAMLRLLAAEDPDAPSPTIKEMAASLGVSRESAREVFKSLERKGLAYHTPGRWRTQRIRKGALQIAEGVVP